MKVCQNGVVICLAMNCCVSELDIITKLAQRIGLSRRNHDVKYNNSLKTSNGQSEAANRRIDNTEHLISHLV
jgi:predicted aspartyl protease